jgi:hypothetical protein
MREDDDSIGIMPEEKTVVEKRSQRVAMVY